MGGWSFLTNHEFIDDLSGLQDVASQSVGDKAAAAPLIARALSSR